MAVSADHSISDGSRLDGPSATEQLADFVCGTKAADLPAKVVDETTGYYLDWLGCAIAGLPSKPGVALTRHTAQQPLGVASTLGFREGRSPQTAAFHNGAVSHITEMDDVDRASVIHPAAVIIPAAQAVAERLDRDGRDLLTAITLGYEVAIRVGESVGKTHYFHWHNTSTCGVFGAAAAAAWLLGLNRDQTMWALGNAGTQASGLWQFIQDGAMSKHLHTGRAAANGVLAAELAEFDFSGARQVLEGTQGFWAATAPDGDPGAVTRDLGSGSWKISGVSIKPYPSCRHTHAAVDAALALRERLGRLEPEDVAQLEIDGYHSMLDLCDNPRPNSLYAAKFSVHYTAARALLDGHLALNDFGDAKIAEPRLAALMAKTTARLDDDLDRLYPARFPARLTLTLSDGRRVVEEVLSPKGDPENALTRAELETKFLGMLDDTPYTDRKQALLEAVRSLADQASVRGALSL
jgi:2-methylcitrate dehydratase PrpD